MSLPEAQCAVDAEKQEGSTAIVPFSSPSVIQASIPGIHVHRKNQSVPLSQEPAKQATSGRTLMPVNIKQILEAWEKRSHGILVINNSVVSSIKIIGEVREKKLDEYKGTFKIQDCTGSLNASIWFTVGRGELDCITDGCYAMAVGRVQSDEQGPELQCYVCRPVSNFNDITHHHLSVIATHIDLVLKPKVPVHHIVAELWTQDRAQHSSSSIRSQPIKKAKTIKEIRGPTNEIPSKSSSAKDLEEGDVNENDTKIMGPAIVHLLRSEATKFGPEGVHIDLICSQLMTSKQCIRHIIDELVLEGEVYTTVDADHLASS